MVLSSIRKNKRAVKLIASFLALSFFNNLLIPIKVFALTGGPSQPEVQSFEPVSANQMVDPFTGDFSYNIPLLDVGGYPINISYHAGAGLDEEASWVGLGWNINPGVINRNMRGIPDDFFSPYTDDPENSGNDNIIRERKMRPCRTFSVSVAPGYEIVGEKVEPPEFQYSIGMRFNNYRGLGTFFSVTKRNSWELDFDSEGGIGFDVSTTFKKTFSSKWKKVKTLSECDNGFVETLEGQNKFNIGAGMAFNTREGIKDLNFSVHKRKYERVQETNKNNKNHSAIGPEQLSSTSNGSASISFLNSSYTPATTDNTYNFTYNLGLEIGTEFMGLNPDTKFNIAYSQSGTFQNDWRQVHPVYGFLSHALAYQNYEGTVSKKNRGRGVMDFNSYGSSMVSKADKELGYTISTYDVLSVSGQGISGVYRPYAAAIGSVYDSKSESVYVPPISLGLDLGASSIAKLGTDGSYTYDKSKSGRWDNDNDLFDKLNYSATRPGADFEQVYYKNAGEKTIIDKDFYDKIDGGIAARPEMDTRIISRSKGNSRDQEAYGIRLTKNLKTWVNNPVVNTPIVREKRDKRNQVISTLTAEEAENFGLIKYRSSSAKDHHIGEITAINPGGSRYVYAVPAYNVVQKEYSFSFNSTSGRHVDANTGLAWFVGGDNSTNNNLNIEEFFDYEEIPAYAHSYLLSAVLSADYVDLTDDGPSFDDNGSYTYIKYKKLSNTYSWRTPYAVPDGHGHFSATYQKGLHSDDEDDKASFIYGEKEIFYIDTILTKTHLAIFYKSDRHDGLGVTGPDGYKNSSVKLQRLDSIELYTCEEFYKNTAHKPLKVVYFEYEIPSNSLCKDIPNSVSSGQGKLTLKKIWFKYGKSNIGALSPYQFNYINSYITSSTTVDFDYYYRKHDRWGNYKEFQDPSTGPGNDNFPYSEQDPDLANSYASAWNLSEIVLPSGGNIIINYEADDYGYVQDREAMEMFKITGWGDDPDFSGSDLLYWNNGFTHNKYVYFKLKQAGDTIEKYLPQPVIPGSTQRYLYINAYTKVTASNDYEYVPCYAEIETASGSNYGVCPNDNTMGYIKIKGEPLNETIGVSYGNVNPLSSSAWQFLRLNLPFLAYEGQGALRSTQGVTGADLLKILYAIYGFYPELARTLVGFNTVQILLERGKSIDLDRSWMRLQSPGLNKKGGGHRVKKILINNQWSSIAAGEESQTLGQVYDYFIYDSNKGCNISSGVASYEPQLGGDENPFHQPSFYTVKNFLSLGAENKFFKDMPLGESVYPSPVVGYRQVRIRNIKPNEDEDANTTETITRHGTGYSIQTFYTSYDFPILANKTAINASFRKSAITKLLGFSHEIVGATQGFAIEMNDMHGKPKSIETYDEFDNLISKTVYTYKTESPKRLSNTITTLKNDGTLNRSAIVGYEVDMTVHPRQLSEGSFTTAVRTDNDIFSIGILPIIIFTFGFKISGGYKLVRTATATKVINRYGILESVTVFERNSKVTTKNVAFDEETGEVLLTETINESGDDNSNVFNEKIYNFTYPAHWTYDGMGPAYKNVGAFFNSVNIISGSASFSVANAEFIVEGDEVLASAGFNQYRLWVLHKFFNGTTYDVSFIDRYGSKPANALYNLRVIRSGRRNMQTVPVGKIVGKKNPIPAVGSSFLTSGVVDMDAVNATAASFSDKWQTYRHDPGCWKKDCETYESDRVFNTPEGSDGRLCFNFDHYTYDGLHDFIRFPKPEDIVNPYVLGIRGNWRPDTTYVYYERNNSAYQRTQTAGATPNYTDVLVDGKLNSFQPFWYYQSGAWKNRGSSTSNADNPWAWNSATTQINPDGVELENVNALGIKSSAIYSFLSKQPLAVTYNAPLRQTLYEGFEDYPEITFSIDTCILHGSAPETSRTAAFLANTEAGNLIHIPMHWYFWPTLHNRSAGGIQAVIVSSVSHTGYNSLAITNSKISVPTKIYPNAPNTNNNWSSLVTEYKVNPNDLTDIFSPDENKTYLLTYWVKAADVSQATVKINTPAGLIPLSVLSTTNKIDGWVKVECSFTLSSIVTDDVLDVVIANTANASAYFDDIRIIPMDANMKSFVYDNKKLRLMATLDENNYATFFEYDEEGNLVRTKKETERGIITISENRQNIRH